MRDVVLVLRALGLGDGLTGVAPLRGVRRRWPDHRLVLAAPAEIGCLLAGLGVVDDVLPHSGLDRFDPSALAACGVDGTHVAVNLHGRGPQSHAVLQATSPKALVAFRSEQAGFVDGPQWRADEHEVDRWCRLIRSAGGACDRADLLLGDPPAGLVLDGASLEGVVVHPGAASGSRRWPVSRWRKVAAHLVGEGHRVAVTGGPHERALTAEVASASPAALDLGGRLALEQLSALVARARLLLSGDTGVAHLATSWRTPSVLLFGPTPPAFWGPAVDDHLHTVIWHDLPGAPADPHGHAVDARLDAVTVAEVLTAISGALSGSRARSRPR